MKRDNLDLKMDKHSEADKATTFDNFEDSYFLNRNKTLLAASQRIPIVINRTGKYADDILDLKKGLKKNGYHSLLILVNSSLTTALKRNSKQRKNCRN